MYFLNLGVKGLNSCRLLDQTSLLSFSSVCSAAALICAECSRNSDSLESESIWEIQSQIVMMLEWDARQICCTKWTALVTMLSQLPLVWLKLSRTAVALAFEEIRTPSGRDICVQKFGNAYQWNRETNGAFQKHLYHHPLYIQRNPECCSQTIRDFPSQYLRAFRERLPRV